MPSYSQNIQWALNQCIVDDYFYPMQNNYHLFENSKDGETDLELNIPNVNLCVKDFDNERTLFFLRTNRPFRWNMHVDHLIFEEVSGEWVLHLIEMKTTVGTKTWSDIKLKMRTSYLIACSLAAALGITIKSVKTYTTYEKESFNSMQNTTNPATHKAALGQRYPDFKKDEWDKGLIELDLGKPTRFFHKSIQMTRVPSKATSSGSILTGSLTI